MPDRELIAELRATITGYVNQVCFLNDQISRLEARIRALEDARNQMVGMSMAAKWGVRTVVAVGGIGSLDLLGKLGHWITVQFSGKPH